MNKPIFIVVLALFAASVSAEPKSWDFVQAIGGLSIGIPFRESSGWVLPVRGDVSGLQTITVKPSALNSGLSCQRTDAVVEGNAIYLTIITAAARGGRDSSCPPSFLGHLSSGKYSIFYRSPDKKTVLMGEVTIEF